MGVFSGIENASVYSGGRYFTEGRYRVAINQITLFESKQKKGINYFCVECTVLHTTSPDYAEGDSVSWLMDMSKASALDNCLGFALALNPGSSPKDITEDVMQELVGPGNPANGMTVDADAYRKTSKAGNEYTKIDWSSSDGEWRAPGSTGFIASSKDEEVPF